MALLKKRSQEATAPRAAATATATAAPSPTSAPAECAAVGQRLVERGHLDPEDLATVLADSGGDLLLFGDALLRSYAVGRSDYAAALADALGLPAIDTRTVELDAEAAGQLPPDVVRAHLALPIATDGGSLHVVSADASPARRRIVEAAAGRPLRWSVSDPATVRAFVDRMLRADADIERLVRSFEVPDAQQREVDIAKAGVDLDDQAPVVQIVSRIVSQALRDRASDIHLEPLDDRLRVRFRVDGALVDGFSLPVGVHPALTSRLKIMSGMNIVERRRPQDGQFSTTVDGRDVDVRVASVSTVFGEKIVMRLLDKRRSTIGLGELGMPPDTYERFHRLVHSPFGMVICAGPTGAGKTTTLYATLQEINSTGKNVTTVEDPVEYVFPGINQIQTNDQAGLTFATGLKAILRQDPDVILVGEIRDADTARIAIQSALTGHFVLSSLHGTDSVAALHRFLDMGIEAFLIASSVVGVVGQRLLRRVCDNCKEAYTPSPDELTAFLQHGGSPDKTVFFHGAGCDYCAGTGYRERIGVYELLRITPELRRLIVGWATTEELRRLAVSQGMRTMLVEAMQLVESDVTTIPEVIRTLFSA